MKSILSMSLFSSLLLLIAVNSYPGTSSKYTLEKKYFSTLDSWVNSGGKINEVQDIVVKTCGKLVMLTANAPEKVSLATTERDEFHFRVDVCTKMTINRVHPQPEFKNKETIKIICEDNEVVLFKKLCLKSGFK